MISLSAVFKKFGYALLALSVAAIGALPYLLFKEQLQSMAGVGYAGLFLSCLLTNASVCLPAGSIAFTVAAASVLSPLLCAIVGGLGTATGELIGYAVGRFGRRTVSDLSLFLKIERLLIRYGYRTVFLLALLPLPIFDLVGLAAGSAKLPPLRFFLVCSIGKILKMMVYVFIFNAITQ